MNVPNAATHADAIAARALLRLQAEGALREVDVAFAALLRDRLGESATVALAGALAMRAVSMGHTSFALGDAHRLLDALGTSAQLPDSQEWTAALAAGDAGALLAFAHGRIALRRYARYEQELAESLYRRVHAHAQANAPAPEEQAAMAAALRRLGLSVTRPTSTTSLTANPAAASAAVSRSRVPGWFSDSLSTRSSH